MEQRGTINQSKKQVVISFTTTDVEGISSRESVEMDTTGEVRAIDMLTCCALMVMSLSRVLESEEDVYKVLEARVDEMNEGEVSHEGS